MNDQPDATQVSETAPRRSGDMLRALNAAAAAALRERAAHSPDAVFEAVSRELESLSLYSAVLLLNQDKRQLVVGHVNLGSSTLAAFQKLLGGRLIGYTFPVEWGNIFRQVVETGQTILDPDPMSGILELLPKPLRRPARPIIQAASFGRSITAPLAVDGEVTGVLSVIARTLVPADVPAITAFADLVSAALENAQLYEQLARREREAGAINVIIQALNASRNVKDVFGAVARELGRLVPFDRASIALLNTDPPSFTMHALAALGQPDAPLGAGVTMPLTATAAGPDVLAGQPHLTPDLSTETDFVGERLLYEAGLRSRINVPLVVSDQPIGALNLASTQPAAFSEHHMGLLQQVAGAIASAIQNAQIYERAQESEARYRHLVENVHDLIFELDTEGLIAYCSPSIEHLGGYQAAEVTGRRFVEFIHPDDLPTVLERLDHVLQGDTPQPLEFRLRAQDGRYIWTRTVSRPVMRDNQMMGLTGIASDITARKEAELALQSRDTILNAVSFAAEQFLAPGDFDVSIQAALARLGEAINVSRAYVFENHETADGILLTNERYEWTAAGTTSLLGTRAAQNFPWVKGGMERHRQILSRNEVVHGLIREFPASERAVLEPQGVRSMIAVPVFVDARWWGFIGFDDCVHERIWSPAEVEALHAASGMFGTAIQRQRVEAELRQLKEFNESIVQGVEEGIIVEDAEGHITFVNPATESLLGCSATALLGQHWSVIVPPEHQPEVHEETGKRSRGITSRYETVLQGPDQRRIPVIVSARPVFEGTTYAGALSAVTDISARKAMEEATQRRNEQLTALNQIGQAILASLDPAQILETIATRAVGLLAADAAGICEWEANGTSMVVNVAHGLRPAFQDALRSVHVQIDQTSTIGQAIDSRKPVHLADVRATPNYGYKALLLDEGYVSVTAAPMLSGDQVLGGILLWWRQPRTLDPADMTLLATLADLATIALENARLFQNNQRRLHEQSSLMATARYMSSTLDLDQVLQRVIETAITAIGPAEKGTLHLWDEKRGELRVQTGVGYDPDLLVAVTLKPGEGFAGWVFAHREPVIVGNVHADPRFKSVDSAQAYEEKSLLSVPLIVRDQAIGTLSLDNVTSYQAFTTEHQDLLMLFASRAAVAIDNAWLFQETQQRAADLSTLYDVIVAATTSVHLDQILEHAAQSLHRVLNADDVVVMLLDPDTNYLVCLASTAFPDQVPHMQPWPVDQGVMSWVVQNDQAVLLPDVRQDERYYPYDPQTRSELCVPLSTRSRVIGALNIESHQSNAFTEADLHLVSTLASHLATVIENARLIQNLRSSETRYRALFEQANDAVFLETLDGRILDVNARACEMLGYSRDELLTMSVSDLLPPLIETQIPQLIERELQNDGLRLEAENVRKDGSRVPVEVSTSVLRLNGDQLVLALVRDISERRRLEEQLRQAQKMEAIGTLAGGIAHDFNNLLGGILGFASLMERDLPADSPLRTSVDTIIQSARRGAELTNQLLAFARGGRYEVRPTDLDDLTREVLRLLARTVDKAITLETRLAANLAVVEGDAGQLHQMLLNLCLNACDAMPTGGYLIVETENTSLGEKGSPAALGLEPGAYVRIRVTDTGVGMDQETQQRIFEPFFTTKKGQPGKPHSGLGLAMVYGIVRSHGGIIQVNSALGRGTTFTVYLPAGQEQPSAPIAAPIESAGGVETILVVDDEDFIRTLLQQALESAGYTVLTAADGWQALETYQKHRPHVHLVILDMGLPRLSGADTFRHLQEIDPEVAVLISSGYAEDDRARAMLNAGARGFLPKPYDLDELLSKVRQVLDHHT